MSEAVIKDKYKNKDCWVFSSYSCDNRPDLSSKEAFYKTLGSIYHNNVDSIICETMASIYEGTIAANTAKDFSKNWTTEEIN